MKSFDILKAKQGHPVCTRDGRDVEILKFDLKGPMDGETIAGIIKHEGHEIVRTWFDNGWFEFESGHSCDLFLKSEQKEGWVNVYDLGIGPKASHIYGTKEEALHYADKEDLIDTVKIKWEE